MLRYCIQFTFRCLTKPAACISPHTDELSFLLQSYNRRSCITLFYSATGRNILPVHVPAGSMALVHTVTVDAHSLLKGIPTHTEVAFHLFLMALWESVYISHFTLFKPWPGRQAPMEMQGGCHWPSCHSSLASLLYQQADRKGKTWALTNTDKRRFSPCNLSAGGVGGGD